MNPSPSYLKIIAGIIFTSLFLLVTAQAASFDCRKARTKIEKLICSNDELSKLDESLSEVYLRALNRADIKQQTIESQRQWLKYERNVCQNAECVKNAYETRIKELGLSSSFGIVFYRDPNRNTSSPNALAKQSKSLPPASAEKQIQFGAPVRPEVQASENSLPLSTLQPPRELATNSEVILISGYEPANKKVAGTTVKVEVDRPGSRVLLVLTSYEKINWQVSASSSTTISGILTWAYKTPTVTTSIPTQGFLVKLPYVYQTENVNFKELLTTLNSLFGIEKLDAFRGSYSVPSLVRISSLDPFRPELTANGPPPQKPDKDFTFDLLTTSLKKATWSLTGPLQNQDESYIVEERIAISTSGQVIYRLRGDELEICDQSEGSRAVATLPSNFPRFSWAMDVAYDSTRDIVTVVTLGGEGFLYRFDAIKKEWIDFRSLNHIDIYSLSYDRSNDRYVAWTDHGNLIFISGDGNALFTRNVLPKLAGFGRLYDRNNGPAPRIVIVPHGNDIALLYIRDKSVKNIWYYNIENDTAVFTYQEVTSKEGTHNSAGSPVLPLIPSSTPHKNTRADEPKVSDDRGIVGLRSVASGDQIVRPKLMSETLYSDKFYERPPSDALVWSKVLLDLNAPGFSPSVDSTTAWRHCNYRSALETLREIQSQLGKESDYLKIWAANQDRVLSACEGKTGSDKPPIWQKGESLPSRAQSDFLYQLGSWNFYRGNYEAALANYERAESLIGTPQRAKAAYMVVRTLAYLNRAEDAYHKIGSILSDPSLGAIHDIARNYRFVIMSNSRSFRLDLTPELALEHLNWLQKIVQIDTDKLQQADRAFAEQKDALDQLNAYFPLYAPDSKAVDWWLSAVNPESPKMQAVKTLAPKIPLVDWMQAKWAYNIFDADWLWALHDANNPYWVQNRNIVVHALETWKSKRDGVWLQIAIQRVHPQDEMAQVILEAAEPFLDLPWKTETPEYRLWLFDIWANAIRIHLGRGQTDKVDALVSGHFDFYGLMSFPEWKYYYRVDFKVILEKTLRWLVYTGQFEQARSFLNIIQKQYRNDFHQWRSLLATNLDEAISVATVSHTSFPDYYGNDEAVWREMLNMLPSRALYTIASDERVKEANRALIARTLFTRAILLGYDNDQLDRYAAFAAKLNPSIREHLLESVAGHNRDKYIGFLLRMPRFRPAVYLEYAEDPDKRGEEKGPAIDAIDRYNHNDNNWWCSFDDEKFQKRIFDAMKIVPLDNGLLSVQINGEEIKPYLDNQKRLLAQHPYSTLIDRKEIEALKDIPSGPQYLSEAVIQRELESKPAASSDEQNERAANLHRAVRTTRYGCNRNGSHEEYSKEAFILLHRRYENTPWAKATPYWFR
jgi:uncharacterized protein